MLQRTLRKKVEVSGIGLHSGKTVNIVIRPASPGSGVVFVRKDIEGAPKIQANFKNVVNTQLATTLGAGGITISTVEHLLAALNGLSIDNALVEVDGPELPILDGSAKGFVGALAESGFQSQLKTRQFVRILRPIEIKGDDKHCRVEPASNFEVHSWIEWKHPIIKSQEYHFVHGKTDFNEIANARTFGFLHEVEQLRRMGLALGGSLENAIVLDEARVLNSDGLRHPDEFARHKVLDSLGDLSLAGHPVLGRFEMVRSGHQIHLELLAEIFKNPANYQICTGVPVQPETAELLPIGLVRQRPSRVAAY